MILIHKYTYQVKDKIKALGGKWNSSKRGWEMIDEKSYKQGLLECLKAELKAIKAEENDPENQAGDLDYIQREWMRVHSKIEELENQL